MLTMIPNEAVLGATILGADLSVPMADTDFATVLHALGRYSVLRFPNQTLSDENLRDLFLAHRSLRQRSAFCRTSGVRANP